MSEGVSMEITSEIERLLLEQQVASQSATSSSASTSTTFSSVLGGALANVDASGDSDTASLMAGLQSKATTNSLFAGSEIEALQAEESADEVAIADGLVKGSGVKAGGGVSDDEDDDDDEYSEYDFIEGLTDTFDELDTYATSIQNAATLKQAWASLDAMTQSVEQMQEEYANMSSQNSNTSSAMGTLLNDLEVMTVTETYKFNRGDYL